MTVDLPGNYSILPGLPILVTVISLDFEEAWDGVWDCGQVKTKRLLRRLPIIRISPVSALVAGLLSLCPPLLVSFDSCGEATACIIKRVRFIPVVLLTKARELVTSHGMLSIDPAPAFALKLFCQGELDHSWIASKHRPVLLPPFSLPLARG